MVCHLLDTQVVAQDLSRGKKKGIDLYSTTLQLEFNTLLFRTGLHISENKTLLIPLELLFGLMINKYMICHGRVHKENNESNHATASETFSYILHDNSSPKIARHRLERQQVQISTRQHQITASSEPVSAKFCTAKLCNELIIC